VKSKMADINVASRIIRRCISRVSIEGVNIGV
jgi:hypothetical protein